MRITAIHKRDNCLEGAQVFEYHFASTVAEEFVYYLAHGQRLDYFPEFARPFFKIVCANGIQIKGIVGDHSIQVVFPAQLDEKYQPDFKSWLQNDPT
jgi:hypothetical protein